MEGAIEGIIQRILTSMQVIAVVGLSPDPRRPSHGVARYLQRAGYRVIPVNPLIDEALGEKAYSRLGRYRFLSTWLMSSGAPSSSRRS